MPSYLHFFEGRSRLRFTHLDRLSLISDIVSTSGVYDNGSRRGLANTYYYRTHLSWNRLPYSLRAVVNPGEFKPKLIDYIWKNYVNFTQISDSEQSD